MNLPLGLRIALVLLSLLLVAGLSFLTGLVGRPGRAAITPGRDHLPVGTRVDYRTAPPTSGPHWPELAAWGIHDRPIPDELQVHNLEKGGVIISYTPTGIVGFEDDVIIKLKTLVGRLRLSPKYCRLVLAPYAPMVRRIALTAWRRIERLSEYDERRIRRFIDAWIGRGPEQTACF